MAKYMLIMRATDEALAKMADVSFDEMLETMGRFNEELMRAGVLVAAEVEDEYYRHEAQRHVQQGIDCQQCADDVVSLIEGEPRLARADASPIWNASKPVR